MKSKLNKINTLINTYQKLEKEIEQVKHTIDNVVGMYEDTVDIYSNSVYGDSYSVEEFLAQIEHIKKLQGIVNSPDTGDLDEYFYYEDRLLIPHDKLKNIDINQLSIKVETKMIPEPWEDYDEPVTYLTLTGEVPWSEEEQDKERGKLKTQLSELEGKLMAVGKELTDLGVKVV